MRKVILVYALSCIGAVLIYFCFSNNNYDYISLGDGISQGHTYYGTTGYGYSDYIKDYLKKEKKLKSYSKAFSEKEITSTEFIEHLEKNKTKVIDGKKEGINKKIKDAELITLSIGNSEISDVLELVQTGRMSTEEAHHRIDKLTNNINIIVDKIRAINKNKLYIIGFYEYGGKKDRELINYTNAKLRSLNNIEKTKYIEINKIFGSDNKYLPNAVDNYPSWEGYHVIAKKIIKHLDINK